MGHYSENTQQEKGLREVVYWIQDRLYEGLPETLYQREQSGSFDISYRDKECSIK